MKNRIIIFAGIYSNSGIGNVLRMISLANFMKQFNSSMEIDFVTNDNERFKGMYIENNFAIINLEDIDKNYDVALYDSPRTEKQLLLKLKKVSRKVIAFDFFDYDPNYVDQIINLYNHIPEKIESFSGKINCGVDYAIINEKIFLSKNIVNTNRSKSSKSILVTFGGEDPNGNTLKVLKFLLDLNLTATVIIGKLNRFKKEIRIAYDHTFKILDQTNNIENYYINQNCVICGGGTTMLEVLFLGIPVIALPQNPFEAAFINYIKEHVRIYQLDEVNDVLKLSEDKNKLDLLSANYTSFIDGKGKERIFNIIYGRN